MDLQSSLSTAKSLDMGKEGELKLCEEEKKHEIGARWAARGYSTEVEATRQAPRENENLELRIQWAAAQHNSDSGRSMGETEAPGVAPPAQKLLTASY